MNLSETTLELLAETFCTEALFEREVNYQKLVLNQHPDFVPLNLYKRISSATQKKDDGGIATLDIVQFMIQNG